MNLVHLSCLPASRGCAAILLFWAAGCMDIEERSYSDAESCYRGVPITAESLQPIEAAAGGAGETVVRQTYSIDMDGAFTLDQVTEKKVAYFGADVGPLDAKSAGRLGVEPYTGLLVRGVHKDGPAGRAGIDVDDIIVSFAGKELNSLERFYYLVEQAAPGTAVDIEVLRKGEKSSRKVELGSEALVVNSRALTRRLPAIDDRARTGLRLMELTDEVRPYVLGPGLSDSGLLVLDILPGGPAFEADLRLRDLLVNVAGRPVASIQDYSAALKDVPAGDEVPVTVLRSGVPAETFLEVSEDELSGSGFNILDIVKYREKPGEYQFSLLWHLLFTSEAYDSVRRNDHSSVNATEYAWDTVLDLIAYRSKPGKSELRLLWFFPISFRRS